MNEKPKTLVTKPRHEVPDRPRETVAEFLARGGKVTRVESVYPKRSPVPLHVNPIPSMEVW